MIDWYLTKRDNEIAITRQLIDNVMLSAAQNFNCIILVNPTNKYAYSQIYNGANTKSADITVKTEKDGLLAGYLIEFDSNRNSKPAGFNDRNGINQLFVLNKVTGDVGIMPASKAITEHDSNVVMVKCDEDGRFITSDIDILMIISDSKKDRSITPEDKGFGNLLSYEYEVIEYINKTFNAELKSIKQDFEMQYGPIIKHGPINRFHKTQKSFIHFPAIIYHANGSKSIIKDDDDSYISFANFLSDCYSSGYMIELPAKWAELWEY